MNCDFCGKEIKDIVYVSGAVLIKGKSYFGRATIPPGEQCVIIGNVYCSEECMVLDKI